MHDLAARVHSGIGTASHGQPRRPGEPEHPGQSRSQDLFDRTAAGLDGPAGEGRPVVGEINPKPNEWGFAARIHRE